MISRYHRRLTSLNNIFLQSSIGTSPKCCFRVRCFTLSPKFQKQLNHNTVGRRSDNDVVTIMDVGGVVFLRGTGTLFCACVLCSCASVSVKNVAQDTSGRPKALPTHIYVQPFSIEGTRAKESFARKNKGQLKLEQQQLLTHYLVQEFSKNIAPASAMGSTQVSARDAWLVSGRITRVAEGSRFLRMGVGLGFGGTKMETDVEVKRMPATNAPFLCFRTSGGSNAMPGAATNPIPFSSAPTALLHINEGTTDDSARTARVITALIADYLAKHGISTPNTLPRPKMAGKFPALDTVRLH